MHLVYLNTFDQFGKDFRTVNFPKWDDNGTVLTQPKLNHAFYIYSHMKILLFCWC